MIPGVGQGHRLGQLAVRGQRGVRTGPGPILVEASGAIAKGALIIRIGFPLKGSI